MAQTPVWALPYPGLSDPADISQAVPPLATRLETVLSQVQGGAVQVPVGILPGEAPVWNGTSWVRSSQQRLTPGSLGSGAPSGTTFLRGDGVWASAVPAAGSITSGQIQDGSIAAADLQPGLVAGGNNSGTAFPTTGLFTGYRYTLFVPDATSGYVGWDFVYRPDLDGTYPWHFVGGPPVAGIVPDVSLNYPAATAYVNLWTNGRPGYYDVAAQNRQSGGNAFPGQEAWTSDLTAYITRINDRGVLSYGFLWIHLNSYGLSLYDSNMIFGRYAVAGGAGFGLRYDNPGADSGKGLTSVIPIYGGGFKITPHKLG